VVAGPHSEAAGGPTLVKSLADVTAPCTALIWMGLGTAGPAPCRWTEEELASLVSAGVDQDDGSRRLSALRRAERHGLSRVRERLLLVSLPVDADLPPHPLSLQIEQTLLPEDRATTLSLEDLYTGQATSSPDPWQQPMGTFTVLPPQPARPLWPLDLGLLQDRDRSSATSLEARLACPLKWVLTYGARLRSSPITSVPDPFQLKGSFCHSVLESVLGSCGQLPRTDVVAARVGQVFDDRLPLDAAPLSQPGRAAERLQLRSELLSAARTLVRALRQGGYQVVGMELETGGSISGRSLLSYIDCLARREDGSEAVVDFKYGGVTKYRELLETGRAVQLATYAYTRSQEAGGSFPAVAYLVLSAGVLYTPTGSPLHGAGATETIQGPAISEVWQRLTDALARADGWLTGREPVAARPLLAPELRPPGVEIVIQEPDSRNGRTDIAPCRYCDFKRLCGAEQLI